MRIFPSVSETFGVRLEIPWYAVKLVRTGTVHLVHPAGSAGEFLALTCGGYRSHSECEPTEDAVVTCAKCGTALRAAIAETDALWERLTVLRGALEGMLGA